MGKKVEIYKEIGPPREVLERFNVAAMRGTHAIGHTRMATESKVTTLGAHPFSTGNDQCLVHNGSLSNHNNLRRAIEQSGFNFETENDSEVAAAYLTEKMKMGHNLEVALEMSLNDLDGFFTFVVGTENGFGVLRDKIACKPAVMAQTDKYVAFGSEFRALASLPDIEKANVWEPEPGIPYFEVNRMYDFDLAKIKLRDVNSVLQKQPKAAESIKKWKIQNPNGAHAVAVGLNSSIHVEIEGSVGYYCAGMNERLK